MIEYGYRVSKFEKIIGEDVPININYKNTTFKMSIKRFLIKYPQAKYNTVKKLVAINNRLCIELNNYSVY